MTVTAADVAARLGISQPTVSRALAGSPLVARPTREKILATAADMGYRLNAAGRSLKVGRHQSIGVLVPDLGGTYGAGIAKAVLEVARARGEQLLISDSGGSVEREVEAAENLASHSDGLLLVAPRAGDEVIIELGRMLPTVVIGRRVSGMSCVLADEGAALTAVLDHLVHRGHHRVAYLPGPELAPSEDVRWRAVTAYVADHSELAVERLGVSGNTAQAGLEASRLVIDAGVGAVIAFNDLAALGIVSGLRDAGVDVPGDVSIVGWDDSLFATLTDPHLTTVDMGLSRVAEVAAGLLLDLVADPFQTPRTLVFPARLRVRRSSSRATNG